MILTNLTITEVHDGLKRGDFTVRQLVDAYLENINKRNNSLNAYLEVFDDIDTQVNVAQEKFTNGTAELLTGIPIAVKDNILIKGHVASSGSKIIENYKATYSATAIEKLQNAGAVFLGRTNMDEFAMGSSTENSAFGVTKNPHDETRVPGGTSGGSAAVVAGKMSLIALGSDTGGSIRQPASFCGVVGLKPTYGAVSRNGLMAAASSFDCIGPLSNTVADAEIVFNLIKGKDPLDSTTVDDSNINQEETKTIGFPKKYTHQEGVDADVLQNFESSLDKFKQAGYEVKEIDIEYLEYTLATYYILIISEQSSNLARYDGVKYGSKIEGKDLTEDYFKTRGQLFGPEVKKRIMLGTYLLSAGYSDQYYRKAWKLRNKIKKAFDEAFKDVDVIAMPVSPTPAFKIGEKMNDPLQMYLADIFTIVANVVGVPSISIPGGTVDREGSNLPVGLQLLAPHLKENRLFELGKKFEAIK